MKISYFSLTSAKMIDGAATTEEEKEKIKLLRKAAHLKSINQRQFSYFELRVCEPFVKKLVNNKPVLDECEIAMVREIHDAISNESGSNPLIKSLYWTILRTRQFLGDGGMDEWGRAMPAEYWI